MQKSLSSLSGRKKKWFLTPTQHFHLFLWLCADHIVPFPALHLFPFAHPPTLAALIPGEVRLNDRDGGWEMLCGESQKDEFYSEGDQKKRTCGCGDDESRASIAWGGWLWGSSLQNSAVIVDCIWVSAASHALSGVRDPKHVSLFVSSQLISSDADGAIQRAGRFRVENGSSDEVHGSSTQPGLLEMTFVCSQSKYIMFISMEHILLLHKYNMCVGG